MPIHNTAESASAVSRSSVYVSLKSLDASDETQLSASSMSRIPRNVQDESLISFYETVSKDYHRSVPRLDGKNTSGRPLSSPEISGRIRQRALTLVGGGYNAKPVATSNSTIKTKTAIPTNNFLLRGQNPSSNLSGRCRKRKRMNLWHRLNAGTRKSCAEKSTEDQIVKIDGQFLMRLNGEWNTYIRNVLSLDSFLDGAVIDRSLLQKQITTLVAQDLIEWAGSLVQIKDCAKIPKMKSRLLGTKGILISHSALNWEIIPFHRQLKRSKLKVDSSGKSITDSHIGEGCLLDSHDWHLEAAAILIPKFGSIIAVEIPLSSSFAISNVARDESQSVSILLQGT